MKPQQTVQRPKKNTFYAKHYRKRQAHHSVSPNSHAKQKPVPSPQQQTRTGNSKTESDFSLQKNLREDTKKGISY
jgi:hypothetical protein